MSLVRIFHHKRHITYLVMEIFHYNQNYILMLCLNYILMLLLGSKKPIICKVYNTLSVKFKVIAL